MAFLKRSRRWKNGYVYESWAIVESVRTVKGPRQRTIATLGKALEFDKEERIRWKDVVDQLSGRWIPRSRQSDLFKARSDAPEWAAVDLRRVRVERLRRFGDVLLALTLWKRLRLDVFFDENLPAGREEIPWSLVACLHTLALWMEGCGLGSAPQKLLEELRQIHSLDVVLTAKEQTEIRLRVVGTPEESR